MNFTHNPILILSLGILFANGESWKEMRRFALINMRDFGMGKRGSEEKIIEETQRLIEVFEKFEGKVKTVRWYFTFDRMWSWVLKECTFFFIVKANPLTRRSRWTTPSPISSVLLCTATDLITMTPSLRPWSNGPMKTFSLLALRQFRYFLSRLDYCPASIDLRYWVFSMAFQSTVIWDASLYLHVSQLAKHAEKNCVKAVNMHQSRG